MKEYPVYHYYEMVAINRAVAVSRPRNHRPRSYKGFAGRRLDVTNGKSKLDIQSFYAGVLSALAIVGFHDERTIFDEIVSATGEIELVETARRDGAMRWSGLFKYGYGRK